MIETEGGVEAVEEIAEPEAVMMFAINPGY